MRRIGIVLLALGVVLSGMLLGACGSDDDAPAFFLLPATYNLDGLWSVTSVTGTNTCGDPTNVGTFFDMDIVHSGLSNSLTAYRVSDGFAYTMTVNGSSITYFGPGSDPVECPNGITESINLTVTDSTYFSGSTTWTCYYAGGSCTGTDGLAGIKY